MTPAQRDRLRELAKCATPGPWKDDKFGLYVWGPSEKGGDFPLADTDVEHEGQIVRARGWGYFTGRGHGALGLSQDEAVARQKSNTAFIAACDPSTILALLDENEALRARIDELEKGK